ncbi:hypothetical protein HNQ71_004908 [Mesorhizobium sangaii]|uniref:Lytic murein transglycosylase n=1 Tax=Mesorhizobium sangaii TaxID=505389 RepID=A0A841PHW3_9HYPH|nr:hypothetical protein [Mesorhizobium sangaii]
MPGRAEGGVKEHQPLRFRNKVQRQHTKMIAGRRDSAPLWPAGHLPLKGGDQRLRRPLIFFHVTIPFLTPARLNP